MSYILHSDELLNLIAVGQKALRGNSNDAEHDALYEIVQALKTIQSDNKRKAQSTGEENV